MVDGNGTDKVAPRLAERIGGADASDVEVVIELIDNAEPPDASGSRQERIAKAKSSFEKDLASVTKTIENAGGEVLESAWLNKTLRGRIPAGEVAKLAEDKAIAAIDLPRTIEAD